MLAAPGPPILRMDSCWHKQDLTKRTATSLRRRPSTLLPDALDDRHKKRQQHVQGLFALCTVIEDVEKQLLGVPFTQQHIKVHVDAGAVLDDGVVRVDVGVGSARDDCEPVGIPVSFLVTSGGGCL